MVLDSGTLEIASASSDVAVTIRILDGIWINFGHLLESNGKYIDFMNLKDQNYWLILHCK